MKQFSRHPLRAAVAAAFLASAPLAAFAGDGPYIGLEGGANWEAPQNVNGAVGDTLHYHTGWAAGLVGGYSFLNGFRPELELDYRKRAAREIRRTYFAVNHADDGYEFKVEHQTYLK